MAANKVTVATPGPAGVPGLTYEGVWVADSVYQVRDCVRYTDGNLYVVNVQHTAAAENNPLLNTTYWTLFINADDAFQWATKAKHSLIGDSLGNAGYSALHQAALAADWAKLTTDAVRNDANDADVDYSAKAWAIGGTEVTTTASRGASKEWATTTGGAVDTSEFSAKAYAIGGTGVTTSSGKGAAKEWATTTGGAVDTADFSAKAWAIGGTGVTTTSAKGASKEWAIASGLVDTASYSSKEYAQGTAASTGGSSKDYAQYTGGGVRGATSDHSAKAWSVGGTGVTTTSSKGAAKEWATTTGGAVDTSEYSAKEYAIGTTATSSKTYALKVDGAVTGTDFSSKAWAIGGTNVTTTASRGAAKEWATSTGAAVDTSEYSAKEYAIGTTVAAGSAKDWAILAEDSVVDGSSGYSALHWAAKAANSQVAAKNSAAAVANSLDAFDDTYLGTMSDSSTQGTNPTPTGTWAKDSSAITVSSGSNIKVGQVVTGTGMPSPPPNVISVAGTAVVVSENMAAAGSGVTLTMGLLQIMTMVH